MNKISILFLTLFFLFSSMQLSAEISLPLHYIQQDFDVISYDAFINWTSISKKEIVASNSIKVYWKNFTDSSKFYFHLRDLAIDSIFFNQQKINALAIGTPDSAAYHYEIIPLNTKAGDTSFITIYYHGAMTDEGGNYKWGGVHFQDNILYSLGVGFSNNYVSTTQHWLACYDHPSDKATFHCQYKVPAGYFVASNGEYTIHNLDDGTDIYEYSHDYPVATSLLTFNVGKFIENKREDSIAPIYVYSQAKDTVASNFAFKFVPNMLSYFSYLFGNYPFEKVGYVITSLGSMESQTMINFSRVELLQVYNNKDTSNPVAAHELSHQWFGDAITPWDFRDVWLNESFATYCEALWLEYSKNSEIAYFTDLLNKKKSYINKDLKNEGAIPLYNFTRNENVSNYPATIYEKGAVVLGMLRYEIGDEKFFNFLKNYNETYKYKNINTAEFINFFNAQTGTDLSWFFDQWIYGIGVPQISVDFQFKTPTGNAKYNVSKISIVQNNPKSWDVFQNVPLAIAFIKNGEIFNTKVVKFDKLTTEIKLDQPIECDTVSFSYAGEVVSLADVRDVKFSPETSVQSDYDISNLVKINNDYLEIDLSQFPNSKFMLFNLIGENMLQLNQENANIKMFDLHTLTSGFYNLVIFNNNQLIFSKKIIVE